MDNRTQGMQSAINDYNANKIKVLEGLEAVRKRPGMYIGDTGPRGLHHTLSGVIHRSCPQACAGVCGFVECRHSPCAQDPFETSNPGERSCWRLPTNTPAHLGASSL